MDLKLNDFFNFNELLNLYLDVAAGVRPRHAGTAGVVTGDVEALAGALSAAGGGDPALGVGVVPAAVGVALAEVLIHLLPSLYTLLFSIYTYRGLGIYWVTGCFKVLQYAAQEPYFVLLILRRAK